MCAEARRLRGLVDRLPRLDPLDTGLRLMLLNLLLHPVGGPGLEPLVIAASVAGLVITSWLRAPALWFLLFAATAIRVGLDWPLPDNHSYLRSYWCLAVGLCLALRDREALALNARLLIGLAFAFAALWKLALSPDFLDGRFLRIAMLTDPRFEGFARIVAGLGPEQAEALRAWVLQHVDGALATGHAPGQPLRFVWTARAASLWTAGIETAVAVAFLWPRREALPWRDAALILFCVTTYAVATVEGFAWLLVSMGVAQCSRPALRAAYVATFFAILAYREFPLFG